MRYMVDTSFLLFFQCFALVPTAPSTVSFYFVNEELQPESMVDGDPPPRPDRCDEVLIALRRVMRAVDLHSRALVRSHGLTAPQALVLKEIVAAGELAVGTVAQRVSLSHATTTDIVNRLERRGLVARTRSSNDRRRVMLGATPTAVEMVKRSPPLLQESFSGRFVQLPEWEQSMLLAALQRIAALMDAERIDAAPLLSAGSVDGAEPEPVADDGARNNC
jgi:DNA-binding MarR family transcriptional regulator